MMTLKNRINRLTVVTVVTVGVGAFILLIGYEKFHATYEKDIMIHSSSEQVEKLIPSLLLPEQKNGVEFLLQKFKTEENLFDIQILKQSNLPYSENSNLISVIFPITESDQTLGYLYKAKTSSGILSSKAFFQELFITSIILLSVIFSLFWSFRKITSYDIPQELNTLLAWTESLLSAHSNIQEPKLKFEEFKKLSLKIKDLIDDHEKTREQAIIGQLTSGIMHDIKTPLHSLLTAYHLAQEVPSTSPKKMDRLENLARTCGIKLKKILEIVENTLDGYRELKINPKNLDIKNTLLKSLSDSKEILDQRGIEVTLEIPEHEVSIAHDPVQINRVFSNLIKNAAESFDELKFSTSAPQLKLTLSKNAQITVEDSGPGLKADPKKVFSIFHSTKPRGAGLGLLISKKIIEAHRGSIRASSSKSLSGACFEVTLSHFNERLGANS